MAEVRVNVQQQYKQTIGRKEVRASDSSVDSLWQWQQWDDGEIEEVAVQRKWGANNSMYQ